MSQPEKPSWPIRLLEHPATTAFGAATLVLLNLLAPLASLHHELLFHLSGRVSVVVVPVLLNFAAVWLVIALLLGWSRRHPRIDEWFSGLLMVFLAWMLLKDWATLHSVSAYVPARSNDLLLLGTCVALGVRVALPSRAVQFSRHGRALFTTLLGFVALNGVVLLAEVLCFSWQARNLNVPRPLHRPAMASAANDATHVGHAGVRPHGRILWILFDELSYRQIYEHRYPDVQLPAFDRLAQSSTVFTHVVPAGMYTADVVPSLLTGISVDNVRSPASGAPLEMHEEATQRWQTLDPHDTVFQDALDAGYSTAVVGWFNPYCRILPQVLDRCFWTSHIPLGGGMLAERSLEFNTVQPLVHHLVTLANRLHLRSFADRQPLETVSHADDYHRLAAAAEDMLGDASADFVLLHLPIPHPGGIYDRHTRSFAFDQPSYLNNLVLCDVFLAHLRAQLERSGEWEDTTLVLMGDHSWRTGMWANAPGWTREETLASDGKHFDDRPGYIVKLPRQRTPALLESSFAALRTRSLFDHLLDGSIETPEQLSEWAARPN